MRIKRGIIGERCGSVFGTIEIVLSEEELRQAYIEYKENYLSGDTENKEQERRS